MPLSFAYTRLTRHPPKPFKRISLKEILNYTTSSLILSFSQPVLLQQVTEVPILTICEILLDF
jgi:hypothetical protein